MSWQSKRIIFAGGTDWSTEFLRLLVDEGFNMVGVMAPPDSKKDRGPVPHGAGRGQKLAVHALKTEAEKLNVAVLQPQKLSDSDFLGKFKELEPDLVVVVAYGKIFSKEILAVPKLGFINFHPSLLPKLRGPSPIASAILEGHEETGVSIMKLGEGMDDGPILDQKSIKMDPRETSVTLTRKLVDLGKEMLPEILKTCLVETRCDVSLQDETKATYCKMLQKEDGKIDWQKETAEEIDRKIRALNPQFKTYTFLEKNGQKKRVNILETKDILNCVEMGHTPSQELNSGQYKTIGNNLAIGTKKNILLVTKLQVEGKNLISAEEFARGYNDGIFM